MRDIKFRAWDKDLKKFVNAPFKNQDRGTLYAIGHKQDCELQEFTGLRDKSGKEIYEGDIIKSKMFNGGSITSLVIYNESEGAFTGRAGFLFARYENEVIGNIFENPTLS